MINQTHGTAQQQYSTNVMMHTQPQASFGQHSNVFSQQQLAQQSEQFNTIGIQTPNPAMLASTQRHQMQLYPQERGSINEQSDHSQFDMRATNSYKRLHEG